MFIFLTLLSATALAENAAESKFQFNMFKEKFGKTYITEQEQQIMYEVFQTNMKIMEEHNQSGASWKMGRCSKCCTIQFWLN